MVVNERMKWQTQAAVMSFLVSALERLRSSNIQYSSNESCLAPSEEPVVVVQASGHGPPTGRCPWGSVWASLLRPLPPRPETWQWTQQIKAKNIIFANPPVLCVCGILISSVLLYLYHFNSSTLHADTCVGNYFYATRPFNKGSFATNIQYNLRSTKNGTYLQKCDVYRHIHTDVTKQNVAQ